MSATRGERKGAVLQERSADGAWRRCGTSAGRRGSRFQPRASTAFRLVAPGTNAPSVSVSVAPRVQVQALSPRLLSAARSRRDPGAAVAVWRLVRGKWRVVAHPILDAGVFRTPLQLRPVEYRITVAAGKLAATQTSLHLTRRMLQSLRQQYLNQGVRRRWPSDARSRRRGGGVDRRTVCEGRHERSLTARRRHGGGVQGAADRRGGDRGPAEGELRDREEGVTKPQRLAHDAAHGARRARHHPVGFALYAWLLVSVVWALHLVARTDRTFGVGLAAVFLVLAVHSLLYAGFFEDPLTWGVVGVVHARRSPAVGPRARLRTSRRSATPTARSNSLAILKPSGAG